MFLHNEMPGIHVPEEVVSRYRPDMTKEEAENEAAALCVGLIEKLKPVADGYYFMTPFNRVSLIGRIIEESKINEG
jgi:homocysteine S-methyltransferase